MKRIVLDTNFIMTALGFKIDILSELRRIADFSHETCVLKASVLELEKLIKDGEYFERKQARLALGFIRAARLKVLPAEGYADECLLALDKESSIIATQDAALRKALRKNGFKTIIIRQKKHFQIGD